jgi:hypothetical protein
VTVIRQKTINPYYLAAFLRSIAGQLQIDQFITGATGQLHLYPRDVGKFWVPVTSVESQSKCEKIAIEAKNYRIRASQLLTTAKRAVEIAIEDSEAAALAWLSTIGGTP